MAALQAELRIVTAGTGGAGGAGGGGAANLQNREIADSLKEMSRFFRRPQQILGDLNNGGLGLATAAASAVASALGVTAAGAVATLLGSAVITAAAVGLARNISNSLAEETGAGQDLTGTGQGQQDIRDFATTSPNKGAETIPFTGDVSNPLPVEIKNFVPELPQDIAEEVASIVEAFMTARNLGVGGITGSGIDNLTGKGRGADGFFDFGQSDKSDLDDLRRANEEIVKVLGTGVDTQEEAKMLESALVSLTTAKKELEDSITQKKELGLSVSSQEVAALDTSTILLDVVGNIIDSNTGKAKAQLNVEEAINGALRERLRLIKAVDSRSKKSSKVKGALTGADITISESSFGLSGAGSNRSILEKYGSEEAKNATGR